jgi:hypothetical protein
MQEPFLASGGKVPSYDSQGHFDRAGGQDFHGPDAEQHPHLSSSSRCRLAFVSALRNPYFWACVVYVIYTLQALAVDFCSVLYPDSSVTTITTEHGNVTTFTPNPQCAEIGDTSINRQYIALAAVHVINALMFAVAWYPWLKEHKHDTSLWLQIGIFVPEILNFVEACLYLHTSTLYGATSEACGVNYGCDQYKVLHGLEFWAATVEFFAAIGWCWSWWMTFPRGPGRGLTLLDPDFTSSVLLVVPALMYVLYNIQIMNDPKTYGVNFLYKKADIIYFANAFLYLLASLRDAGVFFWLPLPGWQPIKEESLINKEEEQAEILFL